MSDAAQDARLAAAVAEAFGPGVTLRSTERLHGDASSRTYVRLRLDGGAPPSVVAMLLPDGSPVMAEGGGRLDTRVDAAMLRRVASAADVTVVRAGPGDADIRQLSRAIQSNLRLADDPDAEWRDQGWWFLWPAAFLALLWFRRGWTMQW